jgi:putative spermidine/putrescine transport system substrate-binding protein
MKLLKDMNNSLYRNPATNQTYFAANETDEYEIFGRNATWICMADNALDPGALVLRGEWPTSTKTYLMKTGTLRAQDFVAIGYNSHAPLASVVVGNEIADISMMFDRRQPQHLAQLQPVSDSAKVMTEGGWSVAFEHIRDAPQTIPRAKLLAAGLSDVEATYITTLEKDWNTCIIGGSTAPPCV